MSAASPQVNLIPTSSQVLLQTNPVSLEVKYITQLFL